MREGSETRPGRKVRIGLLGLGHWGPNYLRVFRSLPEAEVVLAADPDASRVKEISARHPETKFTENPEEIFRRKDLHAVVIATPSSTHYSLVKKALAAGMDVLCEKPLALSSAQAGELVRAAAGGKRILMVAHIFMFNPGILKVKEYLDQGKLGKLYYLSSLRTNLGPVRPDVNVVFDLAAHDISIFNFILNAKPKKAVASGGCFLRKGREDFCFATLYYPRGVLGHMHLSWLTPRKQRQIIVVGSRRMITWDDLDPLEPVKVYQSGSLEEPFYADYGAFQRMARVSDVHLPAINPEEPLLVQCRHFLRCVKTRKKPVSDGRNAVQVIKVLEMIQQALRKQ